MSIYKGAGQAALRQIDEKGRSITLQAASTESVYDPNSDTFTSADPVNTEVKGLFTAYKTQDIDGDNIQREDKKVLIAASALEKEPNVDMTLIDSDVTYSIVNVDVVQPGDTPILYMVQARR